MNILLFTLFISLCSHVQCSKSPAVIKKCDIRNHSLAVQSHFVKAREQAAFKINTINLGDSLERDMVSLIERYANSNTLFVARKNYVKFCLETRLENASDGSLQKTLAHRLSSNIPKEAAFDQTLRSQFNDMISKRAQIFDDIHEQMNLSKVEVNTQLLYLEIYFDWILRKKNQRQHFAQ